MPQRGPRSPLLARLTLLGAAFLVVVVALAIGLRLGTLPQEDGGEDAARDATRAASTGEAPGPRAPSVGVPSRRDLAPPAPVIRRDDLGQAPGFIFIAPKSVFGFPKAPGQQDGPMIIDREGRVRWFDPTTGGTDIYDFRSQTYQGKPVLTYWEGQSINGSGRGMCVIRDAGYNVIARVDFMGPDGSDIHECRLTDRGTMLMTGYETVPGDTSKVPGGKVNDMITEGVVKEIDVATNQVKLEWRSLSGGVPVTDSYEARNGHHGPGYDYFHLNSVAVDSDQNLVISARHTWTEYKINRDTGALIWKLGGKDSDFKMGSGAQTAWQHDAVPVGGGVIRTFDNAKGTDGGKVTYPYSRITWVKVNTSAHTATLVRSLKHPLNVQGGTQGGSQALPNGNTFVGWGSAGVFSEFSKTGGLLLDGRVPKGYDSYRAYKYPWVGVPPTKPDIAVKRSGSTVTVDASWNGSTAVMKWQVLAGDSADGALSTVGSPVAWNGLDTAMRATTSRQFIAVRALDSKGKTLAESPVVQIGASGSAATRAAPVVTPQSAAEDAAAQQKVLKASKRRAARRAARADRQAAHRRAVKRRAAKR